MTRLMAKRKDTWASKEEARAWMAEKMPWGMWDERVLRLYVEYGLGEIAEKQLQGEGVTLRCTRRTETLAYERGIRQSMPGLWQLNLLCSANAHMLAIHIIWGDIDDLFSREIKDGLEDPDQGRVFTSVSRVEDVGHMVSTVTIQSFFA
ncbi:hypothetical protein DFH05DRAFT_1476840 [Lentinula detonsa]|uniref:Uncharacterized protein n=1 Tax=Lentinula detonsa TaxID=2804962 RepID=A0A9W8P957_9AGAR|nr:hypothetical protein DFH05DRAFT_1476840 [Lentinula detonsa]